MTQVPPSHEELRLTCGGALRHVQPVAVRCREVESSDGTELEGERKVTSRWHRAAAGGKPRPSLVPFVTGVDLERLSAGRSEQRMLPQSLRVLSCKEQVVLVVVDREGTLGRAYSVVKRNEMPQKSGGQTVLSRWALVCAS